MKFYNLWCAAICLLGAWVCWWAVMQPGSNIPAAMALGGLPVLAVKELLDK